MLSSSLPQLYWETRKWRKAHNLASAFVCNVGPQLLYVRAIPKGDAKSPQNRTKESHELSLRKFAPYACTCTVRECEESAAHLPCSVCRYNGLLITALTRKLAGEPPRWITFMGAWPVFLMIINTRRGQIHATSCRQDMRLSSVRFIIPNAYGLLGSAHFSDDNDSWMHSEYFVLLLLVKLFCIGGCVHTP